VGVDHVADQSQQLSRSESDFCGFGKRGCKKTRKMSGSRSPADPEGKFSFGSAIVTGRSYPTGVCSHLFDIQNGSRTSAADCPPSAYRTTRDVTLLIQRKRFVHPVLLAHTSESTYARSALGPTTLESVVRHAAHLPLSPMISRAPREIPAKFYIPQALDQRCPTASWSKQTWTTYQFTRIYVRISEQLDIII